MRVFWVIAVGLGAACGRIGYAPLADADADVDAERQIDSKPPCVDCAQLGVLPLTVSRAGTGLVFPNHVHYDHAGNLYVTQYNPGPSVFRIVLATGEVQPIADTGASRGITSDRAGNLYVTTGAGTLQKVVVATGAVTQLASGFNYPVEVIYDNAGGLLVADRGANRIAKVDIATGSVTTLANLTLPWGMTLSSDGSLYVAQELTPTISRVDVATGAVSSTTATGFVDPRGVAVDDFGHLYVADYNTDVISQVTLSTGAVAILSAPGNGGEYDWLNAITSDGAGRLFYTNFTSTSVFTMEFSSTCVDLGTDQHCGACADACDTLGGAHCTAGECR